MDKNIDTEDHAQLAMLAGNAMEEFLTTNEALKNSFPILGLSGILDKLEKYFYQKMLGLKNSLDQSIKLSCKRQVKNENYYRSVCVD